MRALVATARAGFAQATANRGALVVQAGVMVVNDLAWVLFWVLFFRRVGRLGGWDADSILVLQAVLTAAGGIALGLLANARRVGSMAVAGELDAVLALPVAPLAHLLVRRVEPTNLGDLAFGVVLFLVAGDPTPRRLATYVAVVLASAALLTGFLVLVGSTAFVGGREEGGELGFHAMLLLGSYPVDLFAGAAKVVLLTVVPAAFVASVPARLVEDPGWGRAGALAGVALAASLAGWAAFTAGLRRYASGALFTSAHR